MTSYAPEVGISTAELRARISPPPRAKAYHQVADTHNTSMAHGHMLATSSSRNYPPLSSTPHPYPHESAPTTILSNPPRYPESSQRTLQQHPNHALSHYTYQPVAPVYVDHLPSGLHADPGSISGQEHPIADATSDTSYLPSFHAPFSSNLHSPSPNYQPPSMALDLQSDPQEILDYRDSMRTHHDLQSSNNPYRRASFQSSLRLSHSVQHHNTTQEPRLYPNNQPVPQIASRRSSTTSDLEQDSSSQTQQRQHHHHQQHLTPLVYDSVVGHSTSYPRSSGENHRISHPTAARTTTYSTESYHSSHASSSIPMSNSHAHYTTNNGAHEHRHDINTKRTQRLQDERIQYNYTSRDSTTDLHSTPASDPNLDFFSRFDRHADPRAKSTLELLRTPFKSHFPVSAISPTHSPLGTSDNDSAMDSDGVAHEDDDREASTKAGSKLNSNPIFLDSQSSKRSTTNREDDGGDGAAEDVENVPLKKKKKSKMHECGVCGKKFPRPSGLKTHMNTHSNEKPFPCGFPGCTRTFGVRSNAKRHLRTHGIVPTVSDVQPPYVVGFEPPVVLPPHPEPRDNNSSNRSGSGSSGSSNNNNTASLPSEPVLGSAGSDGQLGGGEDSADGQASEGAGLVQVPRDHYQHLLRLQLQPQHQKPPREYKIKWMPLSLASRTNAASLREAVEEVGKKLELPDMTKGYEPRDEEEEEEEEEEEDTNEERHAGGLWLRGDDSESEDTENAAMDHAGALYSDVVTAARLSIPLRPVFPSSGSDIGLLGDATSSGRSGLMRSSMLDGSMGSNANLECRCTSKCPSTSSGSSRCPSSLSSSFGLPSLSSGFSTTSSFITPASSARVSASPRPDLNSRTMTFDRSKLSLSELGEVAAASASATEFSVEERNSYLEYGSHPYHPSQFRVLPGPAPTNVVVPPRYMVV